MNDTTPSMHRKQLEIVLSKTMEERLLMGFEMIDFSWAAVSNAIRSRNPGISETDLKIETFKQFYKKDFSPEEIERIAEYLRTAGSK